MLGVFVEPEECFQRRKLEEQRRIEQEARRRFARMDDTLTELIIEALGEPGGPPLRITRVVNVVGRQLHACFHVDRVEAKLRAFQKIGFLIKIRRLTRIHRNSVRIPENNDAHMAWLAAEDAKIKNLPEPCL